MNEDEVGQTPMPQEDDFDQQWNSALGGELPPPTGQSAGNGQPPGQPQSVEPPAGQATPGAAEPPAQSSDTVPESLLQRAKAAGFDDLDSALAAARNFQSLRGQLPNLEQKWKQQHLSPLERRIQLYEERERQALDQFVNYDPATGMPRSLQERQQIQQQVAEAQRQEQAALAAEQQAAQQTEQERQRQADLQTREQRVQQIEQSNLKLLAINSLQPYTQSLAQTYGVPAAEIQRYIDQTGLIQKAQALEDMRQFGPLVSALEAHVQVRSGQMQEEAARRANANGRYRDVGSASGAGGQSSADRWVKANDQDFERAWQRAMQGELV